MPVATQVKRRRGTAEENNAFTGAEGEITVDLTNKTLRVHDGETPGGTAVETQRNKSTTISKESTDAQYPSAKAVVDYVSSNSGGAMPVGAIFTTPRTGMIAGAVEANGGSYNLSDYSGEGSIGALLTAGSIAYVSKTEFQTQVANTGACDSFGWNGATDPTFLVPKLNPWHVGKSAPVVGNGTALGLTNGTQHGALGIESTFSWQGFQNQEGANVGTTLTGSGSLTPGVAMGISTEPTKSGMVADLSETTNLRVMVQLATGATDQALETCTSVLADVSALNTRTDGMIDYVVEKQDPTADNGYTWYRKYKSGLVEQGGRYTNRQNILTTMPVAMSDTNYSVILTYETDSVYNPQYAALSISTSNKTTTSFIIKNAGSIYGGWQVSGMSAQ